MYTIKLVDRRQGTVKTLIKKPFGGDYAWADKATPATVMQFESKRSAEVFMEEYMDSHDPGRYDLMLVHYKDKGKKGLYARHKNPVRYTTANTILEIIQKPVFRMRLRDRATGRVLSTRADHDNDALVNYYYKRGEKAMHSAYVKYINSKKK